MWHNFKRKNPLNINVGSYDCLLFLITMILRKSYEKVTIC